MGTSTFYWILTILSVSPALSSLLYHSFTPSSLHSYVTSLFLPLSRLQHNKTLCYPIIFITLFYSTILDYTVANIMECYYIIFYYSEQTLHSPKNNYKIKENSDRPRTVHKHIFIYTNILCITIAYQQFSSSFLSFSV